MAGDEASSPVPFFREILNRFDTRSFIAIALTLSMIALAFLLALKAPESDAFKVMLGALLTVGFASAIGWYFQSSAGSEKKDDAILSGQMTPTTPPPTAAPAPVPPQT